MLLNTLKTDNHWLIFRLLTESLLVIELEEWAQVQWARKGRCRRQSAVTESERETVSIMKCSHVWHTLAFFSFLQHLEHHSNHFCPVSWDRVSQDTVSCGRAPFTCVARQQWKRGWQNRAHAWNTSLKDPPCQLPFTVTLATTIPPSLPFGWQVAR